MRRIVARERGVRGDTRREVVAGIGRRHHREPGADDAPDVRHDPALHVGPLRHDVGPEPPRQSAPPTSSRCPPSGASRALARPQAAPRPHRARRRPGRRAGSLERLSRAVLLEPHETGVGRHRQQRRPRPDARLVDRTGHGDAPLPKRHLDPPLRLRAPGLPHPERAARDSAHSPNIEAGWLPATVSRVDNRTHPRPRRNR